MDALVGNKEEAQRRLRRLARAQAPLPFFSWQVKHIAVSNTGLKALVKWLACVRQMQSQLLKSICQAWVDSRNHPSRFRTIFARMVFPFRLYYKQKLTERNYTSAIGRRMNRAFQPFYLGNG
jgi:hypothetical protein